MIYKLVRPIILLLVAFLALGTSVYCLAVKPEVTSDNRYMFVSATAEEAEINLSQGETLAIKNETVYVLLDHNGSVIDQRIINRVYGQKNPEASLIVDYGRYLAVENMISEATPLFEEDRLIWENALIGENDLYYEGTIEKDLPVSITISYYLDGEPISASALAGKSGRLDLVIHCQNNLIYDKPISYYGYEGDLVTVDDLNYVPLLVQGALTVDLNRFSDIDIEEGLTVVTGQSAIINFMIFPYPEAEISIGMDVEDAELDIITFIVTPRVPALPDIDIEEDLIKMLEGMSLFSAGLKELSFGVEQLLQGLTRFQTESNRMTGETAELAVLIETFREQIGNYKSITDDINPEEIALAANTLLALLEAIDQAPDPAAITGGIDAVTNHTADLAKQTEQFNISLSTLDNSGNLFKSEASRLIAENEPGSRLYELGILLLTREEELEIILAEREAANRSLNQLRGAVEALENEWIEGYLPELQPLEYLSLIDPANSPELLNQLSVISAELSGMESYYSKIDEFLSQSDKMLAELLQLPAALDEMVKGQTQIRDGLNELNESGIMAMEKGLIDGINESRFGKAKIELMHRLAADYRSYADNEHNRLSEVQFIMQTAKVEMKAPGSEQANQEEITTKETLWSRLINIFE